MPEMTAETTVRARSASDAARLYDELAASLRSPPNSRVRERIRGAVERLGSDCAVSLALIERLEIPAAHRALLVMELFRKRYPREVGTATQAAKTIAEAWAALADSKALRGFLKELAVGSESSARLEQSEILLRSALGTVGELGLDRLNELIERSIIPSAKRPNAPTSASERSEARPLAGAPSAAAAARALAEAEHTGKAQAFAPTLAAIASGETSPSRDLAKMLKTAIANNKTDIPAAVDALIVAQNRARQLAAELMDLQRELESVNRSKLNEALAARATELLAALASGQPLLESEQRTLDHVLRYTDAVRLADVKEALDAGAKMNANSRTKPRGAGAFFERYGETLVQRMEARRAGMQFLANQALALVNDRDFEGHVRHYVNNGVLSRADVFTALADAKKEAAENWQYMRTGDIARKCQEQYSRVDVLRAYLEDF